MSIRGGTLIAIGGKEDKKGDKAILGQVARWCAGGKLVVTAVASQEPEVLLKEYGELFSGLDLGEVQVLDIQNRNDANDEAKAAILDGAKGVFFTGGDQLRITSQVGDTLVYRKLWAIYRSGGLIAGTSAGASVMCSTMLVEGRGSESAKAGGIRMAPGLGFIENAIIDQHFAERGRMGRLLCAIAENPKMIGIGIDEDTAVMVDGSGIFDVIGSGAVYVIDGTDLTYSNIAEEKENETLSIFGIRLHVLSGGDRYDLVSRKPYAESARPGTERTERDREDSTSKVREDQWSDSPSARRALREIAAGE